LRFSQASSFPPDGPGLAGLRETTHVPPVSRFAERSALLEAGMIQVKRMSHATFVTPDLDRQIDYFTEIAGLALAGRENGRAYLATKVGDLAVQLEQGDHARCAKIAFQVAPDTEFDEIRRGLEAEGVRCQPRNDAVPGVPKMLAFEDPKGTVLEVFAEQTPIAGNRPVAGIGPLKLGHLAFCVAEPRDFAEFYGRVLGFRVSDWIQDWFVFMRCGPDHHTINFVRGKRTQMHHVAFELKDWAQILSACDFLGSRNIDLIWGPGRHGPGHNIYTYHRNPDDQIIELFTELDKMLDEDLGYFEPRPWHRDRPQKPKVWEQARDIWGMPPSPEYMRQRG
jgi:catechol 2,3-dioxygenase-like lactoylglutathione lyase family enzyme